MPTPALLCAASDWGSVLLRFGMSDDNSKNFPPDHAPGIHALLEPEQEPKHETMGQLLFEIFCAVIFLGMIGLVFYNALLRYIFSSSYPPSEEWARFLFMYITFFGAIEAFICKKHIAVDLFVVKFGGVKRKTLDIMASACSLFALGLLLYGGVVNVLQTLDTYSVATNVNMAFINGTLPVMALVGVIVELRSLAGLVRRPASTFHQG